MYREFRKLITATTLSEHRKIGRVKRACFRGIFHEEKKGIKGRKVKKKKKRKKMASGRAKMDRSCASNFSEDAIDMVTP